MTLQQYHHQADVALGTTMPHIEQSLTEDLAALEHLDVHLPRIEEDVVRIGHVYNRGRVKVRHPQPLSQPAAEFISAHQAQELVTDLEWLNSPLTTRLRRIIFTASAPVSARAKALFVRCPPALSLIGSKSDHAVPPADLVCAHVLPRRLDRLDDA